MQMGRLKVGNNSRLREPGFKKGVVRKLALGESHCQIGREMEIDRRTVTRWVKNRDDIKQLVEQEQIRLMDKVPDAVDYVSRLIPEGGDDSGLDDKAKDRAYKASGDVLRAAGILPSAVPSQIITNIYQEKALINPIIMQLLEDRDKKFEVIGGVVDAEEGEKS